ncbi:MAG: UDP-N-acetylmuramoyl-L-alanine--D-glutamate ligase [Opitutales bacterium]|nr:UDP-N-acetylmuramoyl-L-alanine--D-glutamate ligase [Opitutales bacterium]
MKRSDLPSYMLDLLSKPVAVFGYGVSGQAVISLLERLECQWVCYDEREGEQSTRSFPEVDAAKHNLVIYSPGFDPRHRWFDVARGNGCTVMAEMEFSARLWQGPVIAITGTNGKTTICDFLAYALKRSGRNTIAVGNIGYPLSKAVGLPEYDSVTAVAEVSSFQAEGLDHFRADALIWSNFSEDHLDRYKSMEEYFAAKWRLVERLRKPNLVVGESVALWAETFGYKLPEFAQVISPDSFNQWAMPHESAFQAKRQAYNLLLIRRFWEQESLPQTLLQSAAESFSPREHRLRLISRVSDIAFWNDSKATNFDSTIGALENFDAQVLWIGGGKDRGGDIGVFAEQIAPKIRYAFLIGETAPKMVEFLETFNVPCFCCVSLAEAVEMALQKALPGENVLFSPGFSSQDSFLSYVERGTVFENAVNSLKISYSKNL